MVAHRVSFRQLLHTQQADEEIACSTLPCPHLQVEELQLRERSISKLFHPAGHNAGLTLNTVQLWCGRVAESHAHCAAGSPAQLRLRLRKRFSREQKFTWVLGVHVRTSPVFGCMGWPAAET
ncbi:hypothetical protein XENOCAPTIV_028085 [Xenoophorus captivus]|uniref:Uncharacterized protein n=1 Tax=Xenoophorus captivus TaxID=1517983 RepID=A0ABV0RMP7_9TELE